MSSSTTPVSPTDNTSLTTSKFTDTNILNRIFELLVRILATLQNVSAAQANRLTFDTQWQKAYSDLLTQVHVFAKDDGTSLSSSDTTRANLNQLNAQYTTVIQSRQSVVSDDAKALQSNVNQSTDAVSQQSTLATSILQELSTILSKLFP